MNIERILKVTPIKEGRFYEFFVGKMYFDNDTPKNSDNFTAFPLKFREVIPYECNGAPAFSLTNTEVQELVNELCGRLGFKPEQLK